jgi:hypothetical protein
MSDGFASDKTSQICPTDMAERLGAVNLLRLTLEAAPHARVQQGWFRSHRSAPEFSTQMLLSLLSYAYARGVFASQDIEDACHREGDFRYLCAGQPVDVFTLRRFRRFYWNALEIVLSRLLRAGIVQSDLDSAARFDIDNEAERRMACAVAMDSMSLDG